MFDFVNCTFSTVPFELFYGILWTVLLQGSEVLEPKHWVVDYPETDGFETNCWLKAHEVFENRAPLTNYNFCLCLLERRKSLLNPKVSNSKERWKMLTCIYSIVNYPGDFSSFTSERPQIDRIKTLELRSKTTIHLQTPTPVNSGLTTKRNLIDLSAHQEGLQTVPDRYLISANCKWWIELSLHRQSREPLGSMSTLTITQRAAQFPCESSELTVTCASSNNNTRQVH